ncbi:MAG: diaminopimelate epimerase [Firmicutes bacterium]|nr:diaminopimelate epimerase [Bacillota bacterium]
MILHFTKMHGCGNDYVYVNGFTEHIPQEEKPALVRRLSDRHFGIGGDGVIFINPAKDKEPSADFEMEMWNADGTRAEMCGNGIRCVAKYVYDHGMIHSENFDIVSAGKVKKIELTVKDGKAVMARVNMGAPILNAEDIPVSLPSDRSASIADREKRVIDAPITVQGKTYHMTCVSMGNPHAVVFVDDTASLDIDRIGPDFEHHPYFPARTNTEFVQVVSRDYVKMRVYERGTGETLACGTGCCATAVACVLNGLTDNKVTVEVLGGKLLIEWNRKTNEVFMTGPAETVFDGTLEI